MDGNKSAREGKGHKMRAETAVHWDLLLCGEEVKDQQSDLEEATKGPVLIQIICNLIDPISTFALLYHHFSLSKMKFVTDDYSVDI